MSKEVHHLILQDLHRVISELGITPSRDQYRKIGKYSWRNIQDNYGSWQGLIQAAGLWERGKVKQDKQAIRKETFEHLQKESSQRAPYSLPPKVYNHIFVWSDRHHPYSHPDTVDFLIAINRKYNFDLVIDIGDGEDFHAMSFHDTDEDLLSAGHELEQVIKEYQPLYKEFPEVMICESNHGSMVYRKGKHNGFPRHVLKPYREILKAPEGWTWHHEIIIQMSNGQKCLFHHGLGANTQLTSQRRGMSIVQGHYHSKFSIQYWANATGMYFAAQTGCLINDASYAFAYNKLTTDRPIMGCLRIENGIPHLLPMHLNKDGRWNSVVP